jgi:hypothetical protein
MENKTFLRRLDILNLIYSCSAQGNEAGARFPIILPHLRRLRLYQYPYALVSSLHGSDSEGGSGTLNFPALEDLDLDPGPRWRKSGPTREEEVEMLVKHYYDAGVPLKRVFHCFGEHFNAQIASMVGAVYARSHTLCKELFDVHLKEIRCC